MNQSHARPPPSACGDRGRGPLASPVLGPDTSRRDTGLLQQARHVFDEGVRAAHEAQGFGILHHLLEVVQGDPSPPAGPRLRWLARHRLPQLDAPRPREPTQLVAVRELVRACARCTPPTPPTLSPAPAPRASSPGAVRCLSRRRRTGSAVRADVPGTGTSRRDPRLPRSCRRDPGEVTAGRLTPRRGPRAVRACRSRALRAARAPASTAAARADRSVPRARPGPRDSRARRRAEIQLDDQGPRRGTRHLADAECQHRGTDGPLGGSRRVGRELSSALAGGGSADLSKPRQGGPTHHRSVESVSCAGFRRGLVLVHAAVGGREQ